MALQASSPAAAQGAAALCNPSTVRAVLNAGRPADQQVTASLEIIRCTETWITAGVAEPAYVEPVTVVLQRINGVWQQVDREAACISGAIPGQPEAAGLQPQLSAAPTGNPAWCRVSRAPTDSNAVVPSPGTGRAQQKAGPTEVEARFP